LRVNQTNGYYNVDNVLNFALCGKLHQEECHSKKICYHRNGECINAGDSKQWVDIASNDTLFFDYVGGDACNNGKWLTSFEIRYDVTAGSFDIQEIVYSECSITIKATSSRILDKEITCNEKDWARWRKHSEGRSSFFSWMSIGMSAVLTLCCLVCCCCMVRRCRRQCQLRCQQRCQWRCRQQQSQPERQPQQTTDFQPLPNTQDVPTPVQYEEVTPPPLPPTEYPNLSGFPMQFYPTTYYYPPTGPVPFSSVNVPPMSVNVDPRDAQIDADEKLARSIQEQLN